MLGIESKSDMSDLIYVAGNVIPAPDEIRTRAGAWIVTVQCPYCGEQHTHSAPRGPDQPPGFRVATCRDDGQGYIIIVGE